MSLLRRAAGPAACMAAALLLVSAGCRSLSGGLPPLPPGAIPPVVAVTTFRNETGFSGQWELGRGIPDLLVAELLDTGRVLVVDRQGLSDVVGEISHRNSDLFRKEDGAARGRLKHARYLIRGVITDFTQTGNATGWFRSPQVETGLRGSRATVMIALTIIDVETGEVLCSAPAEGRAHAWFKWARFNYGNVSFGGDLFYRTPIGVATRKAIRQAVARVLQHVPVSVWRPRVAEISADTVILNGGADRGLQAGARFRVRSPGRAVTDPTTGNLLDLQEGPLVGEVQVTAVRERLALARVVSGRAQRGDFLEAAP